MKCLRLASNPLLLLGIAALAVAVSLFAPVRTDQAEAAGFFVTPTLVPAGEPLQFSAVMAGATGPDAIFVEGTEQAAGIRINVNRASDTPGNRIARLTINAPMGEDWIGAGPGLGWEFFSPTSECSATNRLGPGDYIVSLDYRRAIGDGSTSLHSTDVFVRVLSPARFDLTPGEVLSGGSVDFTIDMAGGEPGQYATTARSLQVVGPCSGTYVFPDGETAWGQDRALTFPSTELPGNCGNIGRPGTYQVQLNYRLRFPNGFINDFRATYLLKSFTVKPIALSVLEPFAGEPAVIGVQEVITTGQYGERITTLQVECPSGALSTIRDSALDALNGEMSPGNPGEGWFWPGASFEGPCDLNESGTYSVELLSLHQSLSKTFFFVGGDQDGDGLADTADNCPSVANPGQENSDGDNLGDVCDDDRDNDGDADSADNCPNTANSDQLDGDNDGLGDACDPATDSDGDGVNDPDDNCIRNFNPSQVDSDGDLMGDTCDPFPFDGDNDGVNDDLDNCPTIFNAAQQDEDGDGIGTACDGSRNDGPLGDLDGDGLSNADEDTLGTDPNGATGLTAGINGYSDGQPIGSANPATVGEDVGVAISGPAGVSSIGVTVTDPNGNTAYDETLIPHSPVVFSFTPHMPGSWSITARLFEGTQVVATYNLVLLVVGGDLPAPTHRDDCTKEGWLAVYRPDGTPFKNQGACISYLRRAGSPSARAVAPAVACGGNGGDNVLHLNERDGHPGSRPRSLRRPAERRTD